MTIKKTRYTEGVARVPRVMKPEDILRAWPKEPAIERLHGCKVMLVLHGFLTEAEAKRVHERMLKWVEKHREAK